MNTQSLVALALSLACLAGCESKYEVNEKNCEPKNFMKLPDDQKREAFIKACMERITP
ncbi:MULTISPECIES: entry exclusion lipoprotein TrbK [Pseudomonas]|nr:MULTISPECIES: entry exclusion lipoprotein TrbK [Pseudomonas]KAB0507205.1 entry exclusion lipoprotein TrbK [Pseudomonas lini]MDT9673203.1 entry exclusion lipoprotein TrbK [Pseudomonas sp. JV414]NSX07283.1 entry exclusion lipoprotein TrbK [Pseudomonas lini]